MDMLLTEKLLDYLCGALVGGFVAYIGKCIHDYFKYTRPVKRREIFNNTISSKKYTQFVNEVLRLYYDDEYFTKLFGRAYPVYTIKGDENIVYPFNELNDLRKLSLNYIPIKFKNKHYYRKYKEVLGDTVKHPLRFGYMLDEFCYNCDEEICGLYAHTGTYEENIYTSHIFEYEMYALYKKFHRENLTDPKIRHKLKKKMKLRNQLHDNFSTRDIVTTGCGRASEFGVQMLTIIKDTDCKYKVLTIKRSDKVAARKGYWQFIPSGGFEVFEREGKLDKRALEENYSVTHALLREFVEEVYGEPEFGDIKNGESLRKIDNHEEVQYIYSLIDKGQAEFIFLGSAVDIIGLRHELSFALIIHDGKYGKKTFKSNEESTKIERFTFEDIYNIEDKSMINPASVALWKLFVESDKYKELKDKV